MQECAGGAAANAGKWGCSYVCVCVWMSLQCRAIMDTWECRVPSQRAHGVLGDCRVSSRIRIINLKEG